MSNNNTVDMSGWKKVSLNDFVWFQRGFDLPKENFENGDIPVYGSTSILGYHNVSKVKAPGIVTGRSGTLGKFQFSNEDFWPHNTTLWIKDFKGNEPKFVYYLLQCLDFTLFNSGGAVPTLNRNVLDAFKVKVPPLPIQHRIAAILSAYDDLIDNNLKRIKLLEEVAQRTYEEWFVKFRINGTPLPLDATTGLPVGWERKKLVSLCEKITDGTHDSPKPTEFGIKLITGKHLLNGGIDFESAYNISEEDHLKIIKRSGLQINDILFSNIGTLGNVAFVNEEPNYSCKNMIIFRPATNVEFYVYSYLTNKSNKSRFLGQSLGSTQKFISLNYIRAFEDYIPDINSIMKFNDSIKPFYKSIFNLQKQNRLLKESRDILLPKLMNGSLNVASV